MFDDIVRELQLIAIELKQRALDYWHSSKRKIILYAILSITALFLITTIIGYISRPKPGRDIRLSSKISRLTRDEVRQLKRYLNSYHVEVGRAKGLKKPFASQEAFNDSKWSNVISNDLDEVTDCDNYLVTGSTHSIPYLVGDAKDFLDEVGERFASKLKEMGEDEYKFRVNSLLRTLADQRNLKKVNPNAAKTVSSHLYGRSFDISESKYYEEDSEVPGYSTELRIILLRELLKMQKEGKCYVILEDVTNCIHVTVR